MAKKRILLSEGMDAHGDFKPKYLLEKTIESINGAEKMRMLVNHRRDLPPLGYWDNAEIVVEQATNCVAAEEKFYRERTTCEWDSNLLIENLDQQVNLKSISGN